MLGLLLLPYRCYFSFNARRCAVAGVREGLRAVRQGRAQMGRWVGGGRTAFECRACFHCSGLTSSQLMIVERIEDVDTAINGLRKSANQLFRRR
jgi:hypothetical protein